MKLSRLPKIIQTVFVVYRGCLRRDAWWWCGGASLLKSCYRGDWGCSSMTSLYDGVFPLKLLVTAGQPGHEDGSSRKYCLLHLGNGNKQKNYYFTHRKIIKENIIKGNVNLSDVIIHRVIQWIVLYTFSVYMYLGKKHLLQGLFHSVRPRVHMYIPDLLTWYFFQNEEIKVIRGAETPQSLWGWLLWKVKSPYI